MSEMVERLSRVIASNRHKNEREIAAEILQEMRKPTQKMVLSGVTLEPTRNSEMVTFIYQGMIDGALK